MIKIAIIGKPNVGKSSLFNRLAKVRDAITSEVSGTTRDVKKRVVAIGEKEAQIIDTGGIDDSSALFESVKRHALLTAKKSDVILFVVDGKVMPLDEEMKLFHELVKVGVPVALVINKLDNDKEREASWEYFASFGANKRFEISVSHNRGVNALIGWLESLIPQEMQVIVEDDDELIEEAIEEFVQEEVNEDALKEIKVAIIGRVNVGKSSLLNALVGEERSVVSDVAGTTIDPVDEAITYAEKNITFVDTAGIRRRGKIEGLEKFALDRTSKMLEQAHIALLVLDSKEGFVELDEKIGGLVDKYKLGCIVVLNKWDENKDDYKKMEKEVRDRFKYLFFAPIIAASALTGRNIEKIKEKIIKVNESFSQRIPTSALNEAIAEATAKHKIPSDKGKMIRIYYATQFKSRPPTIALIMNKPLLHFSYIRYLGNFLREKFDFEGSPIEFRVRKRGQKEQEQEE